MNLLLACVLVPALLLFALKLSLVERLWEIFVPGVLVAAGPMLLHRYAVRASLLEVETLLRSRETLTSFAALLALEAIVTLTLVAAVMTAHARAGAAPHNALERMRGMAYGVLLSITVLTALSGFVLAVPALKWAGSAGMAVALCWPWLPRSLENQLQRIPACGVNRQTTALLVTPLWTLLSPAGLAAVLGAHMYLLHAVVGADLWRVTLSYAGAVSLAVCATALALRFLVRSWRLRLDGVMLLAFLLLIAAMFLPHLFADIPPPASVVRADWLATLALGVVALAVTGATVWRKRLPPSTKTKMP